jgi:hypothetical protein
MDLGQLEEKGFHDPGRRVVLKIAAHCSSGHTAN